MVKTQSGFVLTNVSIIVDSPDSRGLCFLPTRASWRSVLLGATSIPIVHVAPCEEARGFSQLGCATNTLRAGASVHLDGSVGIVTVVRLN